MSESLDNYQLNVVQVRNYIRKQVVNNNINRFLPTIWSVNNKQFPIRNTCHLLPKEPKTLTNYYYLVRLCELCGILNCSKSKQNTHEVSSYTSQLSEDNIPVAVKLYYQDLTRANIFVSLVAWLSTDGFRWHTNPMFANIPEDLSYSLVLNYPEFIIPVARLVTNDCIIEGPYRQNYIETLDEKHKALLLKLPVEDVQQLQLN